MALVTDSTAYLPADLTASHRLIVVPVHVVIAGRSYSEGVDVSPAEVAAALRDFAPVSTSRPAPEQFTAAYRQAADAGATAVVSAHLSAELSGTYESACLGAAAAPIEVRVVDSRSVGMGLGHAVLSGAAAAEAGAGVAEVAEAVRARAAGSFAYFYVDTLEYLRRGGRIGAASALLGSALSIKPLLQLVDGRVEPLTKVRTATRALAHLEELVVSHAAAARDITVHHLAAAERAEALAERLRARVPGVPVQVIEVGAVVGAHVGPGMVAVVIA